MPVVPLHRAFDVTIRPIASEAECQACVRLQHEIWGDDFNDVVPVSILRIAQRLGGVTAGAFDEHDRLLGFVFGMTGLIDGRLAHWSDMLAVSPLARDQGIGRRLKLHQRDALRALGIATMYWTYDPLVARNAFLNLVRLGARPTEYVENFYGETGSPLHDRIGTDRFIVEWDLSREGSGAPADAHPTAVSDDASCVVNPAREDEPPRLLDLPDDAEVRVEVPSDIATLMDDDVDAAQAWRETTRGAFTHYLTRGYHVADFFADMKTNRCFYILRSTGT